jgi:hypothetical protein
MCHATKGKEARMKRTTMLAASVMTLVVTAARAESEAYDCFPGGPEPAQAQAPLELCQYGPVREAERLNEKVKPAREIYEIAVNPSGFAIRMVDEHVVHIPKWVGIAIDPRGAARGYVIGRARDAAKKQAGLQHDCGVQAGASIADVFPPRSL